MLVALLFFSPNLCFNYARFFNYATFFKIVLFEKHVQTYIHSDFLKFSFDLTQYFCFKKRSHRRHRKEKSHSMHMNRSLNMFQSCLVQHG